MDAEYLEYDEKAKDNDREVLELEDAKHEAGDRDVAHRFIDMVDKLE